MADISYMRFNLPCAHVSRARLLLPLFSPLHLAHTSLHVAEIAQPGFIRRRLACADKQRLILEPPSVAGTVGAQPALKRLLEAAAAEAAASTKAKL